MSNHDRQAETAATTLTQAPFEGTGGTGERSEADRASGFGSSANSSSEGQSKEISAVDAFKIKALSSALYHEEREQFFASIHRMAMFIVVAAGTAALSPLRTEWPYFFPALTALFGLIDLVFDVSGKARIHAGLRKSIYTILADAEVSDPNIRDLDRRLVMVYADEPPCMYAVSAVSYNRAMTSLGRPRKYLVRIGTWESLIRNFWPFSANDFKDFEEAGLS
jgi:hypothetical protein